MRKLIVAQLTEMPYLRYRTQQKVSVFAMIALLTILLGLTPVGGLVVSWFVYYQRAGLADARSKNAHWLEFLNPNFPWFLLMWAKCFGWPIVLVTWLLQGRPASPWRAVTEIGGRPVRHIMRVPVGAGQGRSAMRSYR